MPECSLALAFALDISTSVDEIEYEQQRVGLAAALQDEEIRALILAHRGTVMLMAYEWSGETQQATIAPWSAIASEAELAGFAARLLGHSRVNDDYPTALGAAIGFGTTKLSKVSACARLVLDISGDGANNHGYPPESAYRHFPSAGITVNGLVIDTGDASVIDYYLEKVIRGPGAFVEVALGFEDYEQAMKRKLLKEIPAPQFARR
ncbi:DUF1194 domain-containing protein [Ruegeria hyattellae]|uniref:DUF1194 domain-containing protein n=1 Tax=Ruegeria hyattellae TaxID=3233337 RepID=UPI00355C313A